MVYTYDSKSYGRKSVRVRVPPSAQNCEAILRRGARQLLALREGREDRSDVPPAGGTARGGLRVCRATGEAKLVGESLPRHILL